MKEKTFRKVTFDIVVMSKSNEDAIEIVRKQLSRGIECPYDFSLVEPYHKFTQPIAVREMKYDQEKREWIPIGNGGD